MSNSSCSSFQNWLQDSPLQGLCAPVLLCCTAAVCPTAAQKRLISLLCVMCKGNLSLSSSLGCPAGKDAQFACVQRTISSCPAHTNWFLTVFWRKHSSCSTLVTWLVEPALCNPSVPWGWSHFCLINLPGLFPSCYWTKLRKMITKCIQKSTWSGIWLPSWSHKRARHLNLSLLLLLAHVAGVIRR